MRTTTLAEIHNRWKSKRQDENQDMDVLQDFINQFSVLDPTEASHAQEALDRLRWG